VTCQGHNKNQNRTDYFHAGFLVRLTFSPFYKIGNEPFKDTVKNLKLTPPTEYPTNI
jgi:hypothetical protein